MAKPYHRNDYHYPSFKDVMLVPQYSNIESRLDTDLSTQFTKKIRIKHPVVSSNMSSVTGVDMAIAMAKSGSVGLLHRFQPLPQIIDSAIAIGGYPKCCSIGVKEEDYKNLEKLYQWFDVVLIDIAHGDSFQVIKMIEHIKDRYPRLEVAAGNVATADGFSRLVDAGADAIRVGIGGSSVCTTRSVAGHGMPTLSSIVECEYESKLRGVPMWADGGFTTSGDIVKALAFGADVVTLGTMLAGCYESSAEWEHMENFKQCKRLSGMSSKEVQDQLKGGLKKGVAAEGISRTVPYSGRTEAVLDQILGGIRSGLTYSGCRNIKEFKEKSLYISLTSGSIMESKYA